MTGDTEVKGLKADCDGYYHINLGQLGAFNANGTLYRPETVKKAFIDRLNRGVPMYVEFGRPSVDDLTPLERHSRLSQMDERRFCGVIVSGGSETRGEATHLTGRFKPLGPMGSIVRDMLCTEDETLYFGLRGFANPNDRSDLKSIVTWDLIAPPPKGAEMIKSVTVAQRPEPVLEVEVRGNYPHIGKSRVMEVIKRALEKNGYSGVQVIKQDSDQPFWDARHDEELRASDSLTTMSITLIDNNRKPELDK